MEILNELGRCFLTSHEAFFFMWALAALGAFAVFITLERWLDINRMTDYDAPAFFEKIKGLLEEKRFDDAVKICMESGRRALPRILGAGIRKTSVEPLLATGAMTEETIHMTSCLEKRLNILVMFGNVSTLLGLLGTVFGLIMSFAAVGRPGVAAVEKSAMLATGISAAMNATLVGLSISIPCVIVYSWLHARVNMALKEIDRYAIAILKILNPAEFKEKGTVHLGGRRSNEEEEPADVEVTPMLNLMVLLIPFLLSSSEFVKIGAIEMKLPEAGSGGGGSGIADGQAAKLDLGIVVTAKGFNIYHYFKTDTVSTPAGTREPDIPLDRGEYDFGALSKILSEVKTKVLLQIVRAYKPDVPEYRSLFDLSADLLRIGQGSLPAFEDHESIKIVAEEKIQYKTIVEVMDAARGIRTPEGNVPMFPNVSIAGGIVQ